MTTSNLSAVDGNSAQDQGKIGYGRGDLGTNLENARSPALFVAFCAYQNTSDTVFEGSPMMQLAQPTHSYCPTAR